MVEKDLRYEKTHKTYPGLFHRFTCGCILYFFVIVPSSFWKYPSIFPSALDHENTHIFQPHRNTTKVKFHWQINISKERKYLLSTFFPLTSFLPFFFFFFFFSPCNQTNISIVSLFVSPNSSFKCHVESEKSQKTRIEIVLMAVCSCFFFFPPLFFLPLPFSVGHISFTLFF